MRGNMDKIVWNYERYSASFCRQWVLPNDGSIAQNIDDIIAADIEDAKPIVAIAQYFTCLLPKI